MQTVKVEIMLTPDEETQTWSMWVRVATSPPPSTLQQMGKPSGTLLSTSQVWDLINGTFDRALNYATLEKLGIG